MDLCDSYKNAGVELQSHIIKMIAIFSRRAPDIASQITIKINLADTLPRLGENPVMCATFSQFLLNRTNENEYSGPFIVSILEVRREPSWPWSNTINTDMLQLMSRWLKIDQETIEKTKLDKLLSRLVKKGDDQVKVLAQKLLEKFGLSAKKTVSDSKSVQSQASKDSIMNKLSTDGPRSSDSASGIKRPRPNDTSGSPPNKKQAGLANGTSTSSNAPKTVSLLEKRRQQAAKAESKSTGKTPLSAAVPERVKAHHIAAKPSTFFSSLQSASKKPGTSKSATNVGYKAKDGSESGKGSDSKPSATAGGTSKPAFSFAETMANLNKQKDDAPSKSEESRPPESLEEKRKRLRKEQRRKLRVSFKADDDLVEVRTFEHDPEEELGHDDSMVRDVGDSRGEGQMLKMHKDLDLLDEEDDYEPAEELPISWYPPSSKFSVNLTNGITDKSQWLTSALSTRISLSAAVLLEVVGKKSKVKKRQCKKSVNAPNC